MFGMPVEFLCIFQARVSIKRTLKVKCSSIRKVLQLLGNGEAFIFEQLKHGGRAVVGTTGKLEMDFCFTFSFVLPQVVRSFPEFTTSKAAEGLCVFL